MADAVLSFALEQISTFLREEGALLGGLQHEIQHIRNELDQMKGFLSRAEATLEINPSLKPWVSQVRDAAYDVEDVLDEFMLRFGQHYHYGDGFLGRVRNIFGSIRNLKARRQLAAKIQTIKDTIKYISDAHQRYQNQYGTPPIEQGSNSVVVHNHNRNTWYDTRGDALLIEEEDLVGIERPKKKLMDMLPSSTSDSQLYVISVVGMGGLGKTTLVKKVYDDAAVKRQFKLHIWITVSQSFQIETLFNHAIRQLLKELDQPPPDELDTMNINTMKQFVHDLLHQQKFIIVFDDVWKTTDWDALRVAFPKNNRGSVIIITTRITRVGCAATTETPGAVYRLEPLTKKESWNLFCKKAFQATSCPHQLEEISGHIIERCDGLPLAIVVIGGVLATKNRRIEEWDLFNRSLSEELVGNDQLENMMKLLSLSYYDLPHHLRICFLYFSILPEDVSIKKNRLVRLWIAEGFVQKREGATTEEVAEDYLNELINRSLVQIACRSKDGRVKECRVHDIILQFILRKAREQYITTIFREQIIHPPNKVRRLVIHNSTGNVKVSDDLLKCVRSLLLFESIRSMSKSFLYRLLSDNLGILKVLDLEGANLVAIPNGVFKFYHLKYLSLRNTRVKTVPKLIGKLQMLEMLDLSATNVRKLPVEILKLQQLRHLLMGTWHDGIQLDYEIRNLQSLQSLHEVDADQRGDINVMKEIGKLTQLRSLRITKLRRKDGEELCSSIEKLTNLRSLRLKSKYGENLDLEYRISSTPKFLHSLKLEGRLEKLPQWVVSLHELTKISLYGSLLRGDPLTLLEDLNNLVQLDLVQAYTGKGLCFKAGKFQGLKTLTIAYMEALRRVRVETSSMPFLEKLIMANCKSMEELPEGIEHLTSLQLFQISKVSDRLVKNVEEDKENSKKIAHIPQVIIQKWIDGELQERYL